MKLTEWGGVYMTILKKVVGKGKCGVIILESQKVREIIFWKLNLQASNENNHKCSFVEDNGKIVGFKIHNT